MSSILSNWVRSKCSSFIRVDSGVPNHTFRFLKILHTTGESIHLTIDIRTHFAIDEGLCGKPLQVGDGKSRVAFTALPRMAADESGLVHGGFIFGLADYAAMLAVNHPNVVLGAADVKFLSPVKVGDTLEALGSVQRTDGKKRMVDVAVNQGDKLVFSGRFTCFVLETHVLG